LICAKETVIGVRFDAGRRACAAAEKKTARGALTTAHCRHRHVRRHAVHDFRDMMKFAAEFVYVNIGDLIAIHVRGAGCSVLPAMPRDRRA